MGGKTIVKTTLMAGLGLGLLGAAAPVSYLLFSQNNFEPGLWTIRPLDTATRALIGNNNRQCLRTSEALAHAGFDVRGKLCTHKIVENSMDRLVLIYSCPHAGSGRTEIVRDARNHFTVNSQGVDEEGPFGVYAEYVRSGDCAAR